MKKFLASVFVLFLSGDYQDSIYFSQEYGEIVEAEWNGVNKDGDVDKIISLESGGGVFMNGKWECPKCSNVSYETGQFQATGGTLSKIFDVQSEKFSTVTCSKCKYTEIYKAKTSDLGNIFDLFFGG